MAEPSLLQAVNQTARRWLQMVGQAPETQPLSQLIKWGLHHNNLEDPVPGELALLLEEVDQLSDQELGHLMFDNLSDPEAVEDQAFQPSSLESLDPLEGVTVLLQHLGDQLWPLWGKLPTPD